MTIHNTEIAALFNKLADLLEIAGENPFRIRAYRNAARVISGLPKEAAVLIKEGSDLTELPGIGNDLSDKIKTVVKTGTLPLLIEMEKRIPPLLSELLKIEGLGPKRVKTLFEKLKIKNVDDLIINIKSGKVKKLRGFGEKIEEKISSGIQHVKEYSKRMKLVDATFVSESVINYLKKLKGVKQIACAGSFRRKKETVGDLDILVDTHENKIVIDHFIHFDEVETVILQGDTRSTVRLNSGIQVDFRAIPHKSYGAALVYFTGSKAHNIALRKIAQQKNLKLNEYGLFQGEKQIAGLTEEDVYKKLGLVYIEPEIREDRGEIELAKRNQLPRLIEIKNIRGDLHCHTNATDGDATLEMMVKKAKEKGYDYIAITDHSKHLTVAHGLNAKELLKQLDRIDELNSKLKNFSILKSMEVDILENGDLDLPKKFLEKLDFTVCAVHYKFNLSQKKQTERIIKAMDNPCFTILAHPTGRLINKREPYEIDIEKIMENAKEKKCILELNAQPDRMDLDDVYCKMAKEMGLKLAISTDAHSESQLDYMQLGVYQARRGWLEEKDVINTYKLPDLKRCFKRT